MSKSDSGEDRASGRSKSPWPMGRDNFDDLALHYAACYRSKDRVQQLAERPNRPEDVDDVGKPSRLRRPFLGALIQLFVGKPSQ